MYNLEINLEKCIKCGDCERACGLKVVELVDDLPIEHPGMCNSCGHCVAICSVDAIINKSVVMDNFKPIKDHGFTYEQFHNLIRNRKSIRNYKNKPITEEHIKQLIESVRYIPTGANRQELKYIFITDPEQLLNVAKTVAKKFKNLKKLAKIFKMFVPKMEYRSLLRLNEHWNAFEKAGYQGLDIYLRGAPCLIVIYAKKQHMLSQWDAGIASYNLLTTAETLGMGTQLAGYVALTAKVFKSIKKACKVPKKHKILASLIIGYPDIKYLKTVDRRPLDVKIY